MADNIISEFSMFISKSSLHNGEMRWSAINSDTDWDLYGAVSYTHLTLPTNREV